MHRPRQAAAVACCRRAPHRGRMRALLALLADAVFPLVCLVCGLAMRSRAAEGGPLCERCRTSAVS